MNDFNEVTRRFTCRECGRNHATSDHATIAKYYPESATRAYEIEGHINRLFPPDVLQGIQQSKEDWAAIYHYEVAQAKDELTKLAHSIVYSFATKQHGDLHENENFVKAVRHVKALLGSSS